MRDHTSLSGAHVLITASGTGIGRGITRAFLESGSAVTIAARRTDVLEETAEEFRRDIPGCDVRVATCDVTQSAQVEQAVAVACSPQGHLDVAVANAGIGIPGPFLLLGDDEWRYCCEVNIIGTAATFRHAARSMRDNGGSLIAISTAASHAPEVCMAPYSATKAAVDMMVRSAAFELAPHKIRVNAVQPGFVPTETTADIFPTELANELVARTPLGRSGYPDDIRGLCAFARAPRVRGSPAR